ncbi:hypothetical protein [Mycolicibacterium sp.]|uniref:hypothetical protein n=1 Tax=Mycolicibacterium sp. TaxID=2320850 RepID=UPI001A273DB2|nr:hypothetical protein [Mycolicibacterium sp.]MBJ7400469.1 hypothetical protein [Mycolicibacterium sp.]
MVSVSIRPLLVPGVALATVGAVAFGPTLVAPPAMTLAQPVVQIPAVHIDDIQLASFGLDLYNALNGWAGFLVQVAQDFFFWNPAIAAGIGTLYTTLQPIITAVVTVIDALSQGPTDIISALTTIISTLLPAFGIGLPALSAAAVGESSAPLLTPRTASSRRAAAVVAELPAPTEVTAEVTAVEPVPARANRGQLGRAAHSAAVGVRQTARAAAAEVPAVAQEAVASTASEVRGTARAGRGAAARAAGGVTANADATT